MSAPRPLPRSIPRSAWLPYWHAIRVDADREGNKLPKHPANAWITCPDCEGCGETGGYWRSEDDWVSETCRRCDGACEIVDGFIDPLLEMRRLRLYGVKPSPGKFRLAHTHPDFANKRWLYGHTRRVAMRPVSGIAQAEMLAMAMRCVNESQRWRIAA